MKSKELKIAIVLGLILLLGPSDLSAAMTTENDLWFNYSTLSNSNSIVEYDIEYYIQTDKLVYNLGESVNMLHRVTNLRDQDVIISCSVTPEFDFFVKKDGNSIWSKVRGWYLYSPGVEILSGESIEKTYSWDMKDYNGNFLTPGVYSVVGLMHNEMWNRNNFGSFVPTEVSVSINIIPEPSSLVLFMIGFSFLLSKKKSKHM